MGLWLIWKVREARRHRTLFLNMLFFFAELLDHSLLRSCTVYKSLRACRLLADSWMLCAIVLMVGSGGRSLCRRCAMPAP